MNVYLGIATKAFKQNFVYKANMFVRIIGNVLNIFVNICIWQALYANKATVHGVTFADMITYVLLSLLLLMISSSSINMKIHYQIRDGSVANNLIRPISFKYINVFEDLGENLFGSLFAYLPAMILFGFIYGIKLPPRFDLFILFVVSSILGIFIAYSISFIYGLLTFWFQDATYMNFLSRALMTLFSGCFIPLWFYPDFLFKISMALPFHLITFEPLAIYLGKTDFYGGLLTISLQLVWIIVLWVVRKWMWNGVQKHIVVQGG